MGRTPNPPQPDPALGQAALRQARIAEEALALSREQFAMQRQRDAENYGLAREQYSLQKDILGRQMDWIEQDRQRMTDTYRPLEDQVIRDARQWDSADNMNRRAAQAQADVQQAIRQQNRATSSMMTNMGVNPNSGRFAGTLRSQAFQNAALQAGVQNQTRGQLLNEAQTLRSGAVGMGQPLLGASYGANQSAGDMAGQLMSGNLAANEAANAGWGMGMQGMDVGSQANMNAFNAQNSMYQNQIDQWKTKMQNRSAMIGAGVGLVGAAFGGPLGAMAGSALAGNSVSGAGETTLPQEFGHYMRGTGYYQPRR